MEKKYDPFILSLLWFLKILLLTSCVSVDKASESQLNYGYWFGNKWIELSLIDSEVAIKFRENQFSPKQRTVVATKLEALQSRHWLYYQRIEIIQLNKPLSSKERQQLTSELMAMPQVEYVLPVFRYQNIRLISTDEAIISFKNTASVESIQGFLNKSGWATVKKDPYLTDVYIARHTHRYGATLLSSLSKLKGHPLIAYAEPNFVDIVSAWPDQALSSPMIESAIGYGAAQLDPSDPLPLIDDDIPKPTDAIIGRITPYTSKPGTWKEIKQDSFEAEDWSREWRRYIQPHPTSSVRDDIVTAKTRWWGRSQIRAFTGKYSAWCAASELGTGTGDSVRPLRHYVNNMNTWMVYGPFDLSDATWAQLRYRTHIINEWPVCCYDHCWAMISTDGINFSPQQFIPFTNIDLGGWYERVSYLNYRYDHGDEMGNVVGEVIGQDSVWIAIQFYSDESDTAEGPFIDDIQIVKAVPNDVRTPSRDPYSSHQWALRNVQQSGGYLDNDISAVEAWRLAASTDEVVVAILDTGVDLTHKDLNFVAGFDTMADDLTGDDTVGGYDTREYNFHKRNAHGTACAGIVAAIRDNDIGIAGVAPNARIMPIRTHYVDTNGRLVSTNGNKADGINWAVHHGARVLSNSWHTSPSFHITRVINNAIANNRVMVFATGNHVVFDPDSVPSVGFPASLSDVIAVGASSPCDEWKNENSCDGETFWVSRHGQTDDPRKRWPDVVAPGVMIYTTDIAGTKGYSYTDYYALFGGTSAATPHVAGVAARMLSVNPRLSAADVKRLLLETADNIGPDGRDRFSGHGRVNAYEAVLSATGR